MRKLILSLSFVIATSGVAFAFNQPQAVGEIKKVKGSDQGEQTRVFKLVRYVNQAQDGASIVSGDAVIYSTVSDDGISVNRTTTSADGAFAGIAVTTILTADTVQNNVNDGVAQRNWGYIIVHGMTTANMTAAGGNAATAGDFFITSTDAGAITAMPGLAGGATTTTALKSAVAGRGGFFYDTVAVGDTTAEVQVEKE